MAGSGANAAIPDHLERHHGLRQPLQGQRQVSKSDRTNISGRIFDASIEISIDRVGRNGENLGIAQGVQRRDPCAKSPAIRQIIIAIR
jgi:hypothetical protein